MNFSNNTLALPWKLNVRTYSPRRVSLCRTRNTYSTEKKRIPWIILKIKIFLHLKDYCKNQSINSLHKLEFIWKNIFPYEGKRMINPRICYANEPGFGACVLPYFKANILVAFLHEARFVDRLRRKYACSEARFICITDSRIYHLVTGRK